MISLVQLELRLEESDSTRGVCEVSVDCFDSMGGLCPDVVDFLAYGALHVDGVNGEVESSCEEEE